MKQPILPAPDAWPPVRRFDEKADALAGRLRGKRLADRVFYAASEAGNFSLVWHALAWAPVLFSRSPRQTRRALATSAALIAESALVNGPVKSLFRRPRPVAAPDAAPRPHRLRQPRTSSFPSGHASAAMVAAAALSKGRPRGVAGLVYGLAGLLSASRVYVGIHHASDVVGGVVIGGALGRLARRLIPR